MIVSNPNSTGNRVVAISAVLFLVFDATVLGIGYWMARQIADDAVTINLAGRQRMLSQRMVKALLQFDIARREGRVGNAALRELRESVELFDTTLAAFAHGGNAIAGDGQPMYQAAVTSEQGADLVLETLRVWSPYGRALRALGRPGGVSTEVLAGLVGDAQRTNLVLLDLANRLTSRVEDASRGKTDKLRRLQVLAFVLALLNFTVMLHAVWRRMRGLRWRHDQMQRIVRRDAWTGLPNRVGLLEMLQSELSQPCSERGGLVVGFLDLDGFKQVNDRHGHAAGDEVLRQVTGRLRGRLRHTDLIGRIGGDEFVVLLHQVAAPEQVKPVLEGLVGAMREPFDVAGEPVTVGLSVGAVHVCDSDVSAEQLVHLADQTMYRVKHADGVCWLLVGLQPGTGQLADVALSSQLQTVIAGDC